MSVTINPVPLVEINCFYIEDDLELQVSGVNGALEWERFARFAKRLPDKSLNVLNQLVREFRTHQHNCYKLLFELVEIPAYIQRNDMHPEIIELNFPPHYELGQLISFWEYNGQLNDPHLVNQWTWSPVPGENEPPVWSFW